MCFPDEWGDIARWLSKVKKTQIDMKKLTHAPPLKKANKLAIR